MSETLFAAVPFVVVDVETTGGSAHTGDRVTEVAAVSVQGTEVRDVFHSLVNPQRPIPPFITRLTGISDSMVRSAPVFRDIAGDLAVELAGRVFVAHNARFDWSFLNAEFGRVANGGLDAITDTQLCTVRLSRRMLAHLPRRNLDAVAQHYGVTIDGRHRADGDARATALVLVGLLKDAERQGLYTWESLQRWMARGTAAAAKKKHTAMPRGTDGRDGV
jgi:DNA polymerase-3 subunit epsilon